MNERIQALIEQCTYHYESSDGSGEYETFDKEKFAEMIVRECISKAEDYGLGVDAVEQMKEHFGIEE